MKNKLNFKIKKEWIYQLVVLLIFYMDSVLEIDNKKVIISDHLGINFCFLLFHATLFLTVNYVLIPKLFYTKKYLLFFASLLGLIIVFGVIEEGVVEQILTPNSRGRNEVTWQSIYWFFGEIIVPLLAFMSIKFGFDNFEKQQALERIEKNNLTNELKFLKSQIQPHILFNSLNNLYNFALVKSDKTPDLILKLSNVLRYILYETTTEKVALSKELDFVEDYIDLQKAQFEKRGIINYVLKKEAEDESLKIAPFILIPFIENSFKHSFGTKIKGIRIDIQINIYEKELQLLISNNFEKDNNKKDELIYSGIGLKNVKKRLNLLYPDQHHLNLTSFNENYHVRLNLKLAK